MSLKEKKTCNECESGERIEDQHSMEWEMFRELCTALKRKTILIYVVLGLWFATICGFIWYLNQYDYVSDTEITASQDSEGNNFIGGGDITYGTNTESESAESSYQ